MSIIYDALQKIQFKNIQSEDSRTTFLGLDWIDLVLAVILAALTLALLFVEYKDNLSAIFEAKKTTEVIALPPKVVFDETAYKNTHVLNGVFISDKDKIASINNHFYNIGDNVDGMKIVAVYYDRVEMKNEQGNLFLKIIA